MAAKHRARHARRGKHAPPRSVPRHLLVIATTLSVAGGVPAAAAALAPIEGSKQPRERRPSTGPLLGAAVSDSGDSLPAVVAMAREAQAQAAAALAGASSRAARASRAAARAAVKPRPALPKFVDPVLFGRYHLTARFGDIGGLWSTRHTGLDFAAPTGTPVRAVTAGTVIAAGWNGPYGRRIEIRAADGTVTLYGHLSKILISSGKVEAGQQIGAVGSTGNTTGPHLHFEVRPGGGAPVDPEPWLRARGVKY